MSEKFDEKYKEVKVRPTKKFCKYIYDMLQHHYVAIQMFQYKKEIYKIRSFIINGNDGFIRHIVPVMDDGFVDIKREGECSFEECYMPEMLLDYVEDEPSVQRWFLSKDTANYDGSLACNFAIDFITEHPEYYIEKVDENNCC